MLPETILQFGGGNFLRAFVDVFVDDSNRQGHAVGRIVIVQSTPSGVAETINQQNGRYHVVTRGLRGGKKVDEAASVESVSRALDARFEWQNVLDIGASAELRYIVSNTTEAGLVLDPKDVSRPVTGTAPFSFPAKLLDLLWHRYEQGMIQPIAILPCELLPKNGDFLRSLVLSQAATWNAPAKLVAWLGDACAWINSLVDRIVSGRPESHPLLATDPLLTVAEPFALWAIEHHDRVALFDHPAIERVSDTGPCELRKVRILNAAHTALVIKAIPMGMITVREAVEHPDIGPWLLRLLHDEVVPTINDRVPGAAAFVATTLERFANPFLEHRLASIALNHEAKVKTRLVPTRDEYIARFGKQPRLLGELLAKR